MRISERLLEWARVLEALAIVGACGVVAVCALRVQRDASLVQRSTNAQLAEAMRMAWADNELAQRNGRDLDATIRRANLLMKNAQYLVLNAGLAVKGAREQETREGEFLDKLQPRLLQAADNVNLTMQATAKTVSDLQPVEAQAEVVLANTNRLVADPQIPRLIEASANLTTQAAGIASDTHKVTHHIEQQIDHPGPHRWWSPKLWWQLLVQSAQLAHDL